MKILAVETTSSPASCAVLENGTVLAYAMTHTGLTHSRTLMPMISNMLDNASIRPEDIGMYAAAHGPGSFTGVRIGVCTVKGMAFARGTPCAGISALAAMARFPGGGAGFNGVVCPVMDARRTQVYTAMFSSINGHVARMTDDCALSVEQLVSRITQAAAPVLLIGDGAELCYNACASAGISGVMLAGASCRYQSAIGVALEAEIQNAPISHDMLRPVYLRLPQAERELAERKLSLK